MIDLVPRSEPGQMAGRRGPHGVRHQLGQPGRGASRTRASSDYVLEGIVAAIERGAQAHRPGARPVRLLPRRNPGRDRARLARGQEAARTRSIRATLIGSLVDFADMRDWSAFVHEGHLAALEDHLEDQGFIDSARAAAAVRGDARQRPHLVVGGQPLSARPAGAAVATCSTGSRMARASRPPSSRATTATCCSTTGSRSRPGSRSAACRSTSPRSRRRCWSIALKDDHVSAWEAVYRRRARTRRRLRPRRIGPQCRGDQPARRQQARLLDQRQARPASADEWLESATAP